MTRDITEGTVRGEWDMTCPKCDHDDSLRVEVRTWVDLLPHGTDGFSDHEWDDDSDCMCENCQWAGKVADARIDIVQASLRAANQRADERARFSETDWQYEVGNGDTKLGYDEWRRSKVEANAPPALFEPDAKYFWWSNGEVGPAIITGERLSEILHEVNHENTTTEMIEAIDMTGFWIGFIHGSAVVVMSMARLLSHHTGLGFSVQAGLLRALGVTLPVA